MKFESMAGHTKNDYGDARCVTCHAVYHKVRPNQVACRRACLIASYAPKTHISRPRPTGPHPFVVSAERLEAQVRKLPKAIWGQAIHSLPIIPNAYGWKFDRDTRLLVRLHLLGC